MILWASHSETLPGLLEKLQKYTKINNSTMIKCLYTDASEKPLSQISLASWVPARQTGQNASHQPQQWQTKTGTFFFFCNSSVKLHLKFSEHLFVVCLQSKRKIAGIMPLAECSTLWWILYKMHRINGLLEKQSRSKTFFCNFLTPPGHY